MTAKSGGRLVVHAHFYQPAREDPFTGIVPREPAAAPAHDWNDRIDADCYRPNAERGAFRRISFDLGPTLARWLERADPPTYRAIVEQGTANADAMAQPYHHTILPLASLRDRRTEIRWGLRDFELRFGRRPQGAWLPETAVDLPTLRLLAAEGVAYTILAPWQAADPHLDTRRPRRVELGGGRSIVVVFYDGVISAAVSFDPAATADADSFARDVVAPQLGSATRAVGDRELVLVATDGELYGHHRQFRDLFLERLVAPAAAVDRSFEIGSLSEVVGRGGRTARQGAKSGQGGQGETQARAARTGQVGQPFSPARIVERTSWSCHHGIARWGWECPDAADGRWKAPLRAALERLAAGIDEVTVREFGALRGQDGAPLDPWAARDAYVDVVDGREEPDAFVGRLLARGARREDRLRLLDLLEAQRWRLAMFASDAWFWDDPTRPETRQALRQAARAVRLVDGGPQLRPVTPLEARLVEDLALFSSPSSGEDGATIYRRALREVGQPPPG